MDTNATLIPTAAAVITHANQVLLVTHGEKAGHVTGKIGLPSAHVEEGETEQVTVLREIKETSITVTKEELRELPKKYDADLVGKN